MKKEFFPGLENLKIIHKNLNDPLYKNSIYLILNTLIIGVLGFIFWTINAKLYSVEEIGLVTTIISIMGLIASFSNLGFGTSLIRHLFQSKAKNENINTYFIISSIIAFVGSIIFLLGVKTFSSGLEFIQKNLFLSIGFIFVMIISTINSLVESVFVAYRNTKYILIKNVINDLTKIILSFFVVSFGAYGIFGSIGIGILIGLSFSFLVLIFKFSYKPQFKINKVILKTTGGYSFKNYIANFMGGISSMILPLIITTLINSEATAHFYMAFTIANLLFIIPSAVTTSLFAEGSAKEEIKEEIKKSIKFISIFIILGIILILLFGRYFLLLFGKTYSSEGYILLNILALSGIFISINSIFSIILKIKKQMKKLIIINSISAIITVGLSIIFIKFIPTLGIKGVGISWLIGQAIVSLIYLMFFKGITQERIN